MDSNKNLQEQSEKQPEKDQSTSDKLFDKTADTLNWWNKLATINADDPIYVGFLKILVRIAGILILIAISPLILLGLIVGFTAAL